VNNLFGLSARLERLVTSVERAESLDGPADAVAGVVSRIIKPAAVTDVLSGSWLGHPVHPLLVSVPIGAWISAGVLDLSSSSRPAEEASRRLVGLGVLAALPTMATGGADWTFTDGAERRVGFVHAMANWSALASYSLSWLARRRGTNRTAVVTALAGTGLLAVGGYLGGHLAYAAGVGVDTTAFSGGPEEWTAAAKADELSEGELLGAAVGPSRVVLAKDGGSIAALANRCTHRGAPLAEGEQRDGCVVCPWHNSIFRLDDGAVVQGPATRPQPVYETRVVDGTVEVRRQETRALRTEPVGS
jgi:nitrite reductase/ring-hydroxylating ferredoxin subunit/uncharacterized membrane protein